MIRFFAYSRILATGAPAPSAQIDVFDKGTLNHSPIFSDDGITPLANPFNAGSDGFFFFYAATGHYDIKLSGGGILTPYTWGDIFLVGVLSVNGLTGAITLAVGSAGTDFTITPAGATITFDLPSASAANRGLVTTGAQTFAGVKTFSTPIAIGSGGTGLNAAPGNGQLLIGSGGTAFALAGLTGTANQVVVTTGAGSITLSLPQSIHTAATPTFQDLDLTGGLNVGFAGAVVADVIGLGDANFAFAFNVGNPQIGFDSGGDTFRYTRATNLYQWFIGATEYLSLTSSGLDVATGLIVGFAGTPGNKQIQLGDANFRLDYNAGVNPVLVFDSNDFIVYTRATNIYQFEIATTEIMAITASGLQVDKGLIVGFAGTPGDKEIQVGDANFKLDYFSATETRLQFDTNDYLYYDRTANRAYFIVGSATIVQIDATGIRTINGSAGTYSLGNLGGTAGLFFAASVTGVAANGAEIIRFSSDGATVAYWEMAEFSDAAAPAANKVRVYCRDSGAGKTQLVARFNTGAVQVIAVEP